MINKLSRLINIVLARFGLKNNIAGENIDKYSLVYKGKDNLLYKSKG